MAAETALSIVSSSENMTIEEIKHVQNQVHKLLSEVMKEGIDNDYAVIPGTQKLSLLKPGAEKICNLFRFVAVPRVEEFRDGDDVTFRVYVSISTPSGRLLGEGVGQASTKETKFAWRRAVCTEEYEAAEPSLRRVKWDRDGDPTLQVRENPADKENNMLKIGKKRALIDAVLTVTGCSNLFTQDREEDIDGNGAKSGKVNGQNKAAANDGQKKDNGPIVDPKKAGRFYYIWSKDRNPPRPVAEVNQYLKQVCGVDDSRKMPEKFYAEACRWALSMEPVPAPAATEPAKPDLPKKEMSPEETQAREAFSILGWDEKTQTRFIDSYKGDWNVIHGELKILVMKREQR